MGGVTEHDASRAVGNGDIGDGTVRHVTEDDFPGVRWDGRAPHISVLIIVHGVSVDRVIFRDHLRGIRGLITLKHDATLPHHISIDRSGTGKIEPYALGVAGERVVRDRGGVRQRENNAPSIGGEGVVGDHGGVRIDQPHTITIVGKRVVRNRVAPCTLELDTIIAVGDGVGRDRGVARLRQEDTGIFIRPHTPTEGGKRVLGDRGAVYSIQVHASIFIRPHSIIARDGVVRDRVPAGMRRGNAVIRGTGNDVIPDRVPRGPQGDARFVILIAMVFDGKPIDRTIGGGHIDARNVSRAFDDGGGRVGRGREGNVRGVHVQGKHFDRSSVGTGVNLDGIVRGG